MTELHERIWDLYTLRATLREQLADVEGLLNDALNEAVETGLKKLPNGYTVKKSISRDISMKKFETQYPEIYQAAIKAKVDGYRPDLTKTDVKAAIAGATEDKAEQQRILESIESGSASVKFSLCRPLDPHASEREVSE